MAIGEILDVWYQVHSILILRKKIARWVEESFYPKIMCTGHHITVLLK